ncbi:hypothetical protein M9980_13800 [Sphingomonas donggukensis]|uniref:Spore coat protein U domain-containing protein n=1 Tax=Sphingomonas donggukensis TaxID=2949093 RepID=A0ABY4TT44_9SPHN|nr:hypothetical protein [Sphingomonas donggukensis]URW75578.1 hypothetical protein M9980_13800 [Sphingomonas donggukensis]
MSISKLFAMGVLASVGAMGLSGTANADTLTTSGSVTPVCSVTSTARSFDAQKATIQNIAGVVVKCNIPGTKSLTVDPLNGFFSGPTNLDYLLTLDLDGGLLPFNAVNFTGAPQSSVIGAPDANVAGGLPGNFSVTLLNTAFLAGSYTETWVMTVA